MKSLRRVFGASFVFSAVGLGHLVMANPVGESVVGGAASFDRTRPGKLTINQATDRLIINWRDFSIGRGETTSFLQPSATSIAVNRVLAGNPSKIYGNLDANGIVYLINPNGILVGPSGAINTRTFVGSTLDAPDSSFMSGTKLTLSGNSEAAVVNQGTIEAIGGDVFLVGRTVENFGTIRASSGTVGLGAGSEVMIVPSGNERLSVIAGGGSSAVGVNNQGTVEAVAAELKAAGGNIYALAINNGGIVRATGVRNQNGRVFLTSDGGNIENSGVISAHNANGGGGSIVLDGGRNEASPATVINSGTLEARGEVAGTKGGTVQVTGDHVGLFDDALVDVSGQAGGGTALIGGDYEGNNPLVQNAQATHVSKDALIRADALARGNGGKVVVFAEGPARIYGNISARGGALGGNGGVVETSGKSYLEVGNTPDVQAPNGRGGTWLIDPRNITIVNGGGATGIGTVSPFQSTADDADLGVDLIQTALTGGATVLVQTGGTGGQQGNITWNANADLDYNGKGGATLELSAHNNITINGDIVDSVAGGDSLNLILRADSDLSGGGIVDVNSAIDTASGAVTIIGADVTLGGGTFSGTGPLILRPSTAASTVGIGDGASGTFGLNDAEIGKLTGASYSSITIGRTADGTGAVEVDAGGAPGTPIVFDTAVTIAGGSIVLTDPLDAGANAVTLTARTGSITGGADPANVIASSLSATAATGIDLDTTIGTLTLASVTGIGNIDISDTAGGLAVSSARTVDGSITINATAGNLTLAEAAIQADAGVGQVGEGAVILSTTTSGNITGTAGGAADVVGGDITLTAAGAGTIGTDASTPLEVNATDVLAAQSGTGPINIVDTSGSVILGAITTAADIKLQANAGSVLNDGLAGTVVRSTAGTTTITAVGAGSNIGAGNDALDVEASPAGTVNLVAASGAVHVSVITAGNVEFTASTDNGTDITTTFARGADTYNATYADGASGSFSLKANGSILDTAAIEVLVPTATLSLTAGGAAGTIGTVGQAVLTRAGALTASTPGGAADHIFLTEADGLNGLNLNAGLGNANLTLTLGGIADTDVDVDITAANALVTLSDVTAQNVGTLANRINTSVGDLSVNTSAGGGSQFLNEVSGLTALNLDAGVGAVDLTLTAGSIADTDGLVDITAASATITLSDVTAQNVGALANRINTSVGDLSVNTSAGGGSQFLNEASGLTALNLDSGVGAVDLTLTAGAIADTDVGTDITAASATIVAAGFGASGAGNAINTSVDSLSVNTSAGGGSQFITEANGLTALDLNAGAGSVNLVLSAGSVADADGNADITAAAATVAAAGFGAVGNAINTSVDNLSVNTSAVNGSQFITEANGLSGLDLNAGSGNVNLTLTLGGVQDSDGSTDITAAGTTITLSDATAQNIGNLFGAIGTSVDSLAVSTATGNGSMVIVEANGLTDLNLNLGTGSGILALTAGSLVDTDGANDITSDGSVFVTVNGAGSSIGSVANPIGVGGSAGSVSLSAVDGSVHVHANAAGGNDITLTSSTLNAGDITTEFSQPGKNYTVTYDNGTTGDLTIRGNGNISTLGGVTLLTPGTLNLMVAGQIGAGAGSPLVIDAGTFSVTTGNNDISLFDTAGGLVLGLINAGAGAVNLTVQDGDLTSASVDGNADVIGGAVNLTAIGAGSSIGGSAANRLEINATTSLTADTAGGVGDGIFVQDTAGGLSVARVDAGSGAVNLNVVDGPLTSAAVDGNADIIGGDVTLAVSGAGNDIGAGAVNPIEIDAVTLSATTAGAAGDNIFVLDTAGGVAAGLISAGLGNVNLSVLNGALTSAAVDGTADIVGNLVTLTVTGAGMDIGVSAASRLEVNAVTLSASTAGDTDADIHLVDTTGGVAVDLVNAGVGDVNLSAVNGSLTSANVDGTPDIVGAIVSLGVTGAGNDIGASAANRLEVNATTLSASTAGATGDDIFLVDTAGGLAAGLITAGAGNVNLRVTGGSLIEDGDAGSADIVGNNVTLAVTGAGSDIGVNGGTRLEINATTLTASTDGLAGDDIFVVDLSGGLGVEIVNAGAGQVLLRAEGGNLTSANVNGVADVVGAVINLAVTGAGSKIGASAANRLEIDATTALIAETDPTTIAGPNADINIVDTAGGVVVELVDAGAGAVNLEAVNGNITSFVVDGNGDLFGGAVNLTTTGAGSIGTSTTQPLEVGASSLEADAAGNVSVLDVAGGLTLNDITATGGVLVRSSEGLTLGGPITAGPGQNIVLTAEGFAFPVIEQGASMNVSGGGKWFIYSTSPQFNNPQILSLGGALIFGGLEVDKLTFEKSFDVNAPVFDTPGEGNLVFSAPDGGEDFDEITKFFADFIPVEDYRAVAISFGDYDPTKFGEVGDLWLSSSELYEEERKAGKAPRVAPEKIEQMKFLIRGK